MSNFCLDQCVCEYVWAAGSMVASSNTAMDWGVQKLWRFVHVVLSVVILSTGLCCVSERKLVPERFSGQKVFVVCFFFFVLSHQICTSRNGTFHFYYTLSFTWSVRCPAGNWIKSDTYCVSCPAVPEHVAAMRPPLTSCHNSCTSGIENKAPPILQMTKLWQKEWMNETGAWLKRMDWDHGERKTWWLLIKQPHYAAKSHYMP